MNVQTSQKIVQLYHSALNLQQAGKWRKASRLYQQLLALAPDHPQANHNLGLIALDQHQLDEGLALLKKALNAAPQESILWISYLQELMRANKPDVASEVLLQARQSGLSDPALDHIEHQLQTLNQQPSDIEEQRVAEKLLQQEYEVAKQSLIDLTQRYPQWLNGWKMLSDVQMLLQEDATMAARHALALNAKDAREHCYYGLVLKKQGRLREAAEAFSKAVSLDPNYAVAHNNLGIVLKDMGDMQGGLAHFERALTLQPGYHECFSNWLFNLSHTDRITPEKLLEAHLAYAHRYEKPLKKQWPTWSQAHPKEVLTIGFVSADFRNHSVAHFLLPVLRALASLPSLRLLGYYNSSIIDTRTLEIKPYFAEWHQVETLSDEMLSQKIKADGVDILMDLSGHTSGNRLLVFARKPAPIQMSWLGYMNTTGLEAMDYYLADDVLMPSGGWDQYFSEKIIRLPVYTVFSPEKIAPSVNFLPALKNGYLTFGCFNRPNKLTNSTLHLWGKILQAIPDARLLLGGLPATGMDEHLTTQLEESGVARSRVTFHSRTDMAAYLSLHHQIDLNLDTFPSSGVTTTFHSAWMGVPTLSVKGDRLSNHGAAAIMQHLGVSDCVANTPSALIERAIYWSSHLEALQERRASMRTRFLESPMNRPADLAKVMEKMFRAVWGLYCARQPARSLQFKFDAD